MAERKTSSLHYAISKAHPLPATARKADKRPLGAKYPIKDMDVGDSFIEVEDGLSISTLGQRLVQAKKFYGIEKYTFTFRLVDVGEGKMGIRVWRAT